VYILDTNILSALMQSPPVAEVAAWVDAQNEELLFTTSISQAEIFSGIAIMPSGRRRHALEAAARAMFADDFEDRVLPFDCEAAEAYAMMFATRRQTGRPTTTLDLMIASIARAHRASMVTRDIGDFELCGLTLINPWTVT
jgi:predicted nucleic acid-binding protein